MKKRKVGRPPKSQEFKNKICKCIAEGKTLRQIAKLDDGVSMETVNDWRRNDKEFAEQYVRAKQIQADVFIEEVEELTRGLYKDAHYAYHNPDAQQKQPPAEMTAALRLLVDTRKWYASKVFPKVYGDVKPPAEEQGERNITIVIDSDDAKA